MNPAIAAAIGALLGAVAVHFAARRSAAQPVGVDVDAEAAVIAGVLAAPERYRLLVVLEDDDFALERHRSIWAHLGELAVDDEDEAHQIEAGKLGLPCRRLDLGADELRDRLESQGLLEGVDTVAPAGPVLSEKELLEAGRKVQTAAGDRSMTGLVPPIEGPPGGDPLVRVVRRPGVVRYVASAIGCAAGAALVAGAGASGWALAAGLVLLAGSAVCALVDLDTLYIDLPVLAVTGAGASALVVASVAQDWWPRVRVGLVVVVAVVGVLELTALVWGKVRHSVGLGGGDGILLLPVLFVPVVATGRWEAGVWGLLAALVLTVAGQLVMISMGRARRDEPFAWGPYLVAGWPIGWYLAATVGGG